MRWWITWSTHSQQPIDLDGQVALLLGTNDRFTRPFIDFFPASNYRSTWISGSFFLQREWWIRRSMALETSYQNSFEMPAIRVNVRPQSNSNFAPDKMTGAVAWTGRFLGIMRPPVWLTCTAIDSSWNALSDVFWVQSDRSQRSAVNSRKRNVTRGFSLTERNFLDFGATKRLNIAIDSSWKFLFTIFWLEFDQTKNSATNRRKWSESNFVTKKVLQLINYNLVNFKFKACIKIPIDSSWKALFSSFWV